MDIISKSNEDNYFLINSMDQMNNFLHYRVKKLKQKGDIKSYVKQSQK